MRDDKESTANPDGNDADAAECRALPLAQRMAARGLRHVLALQIARMAVRLGFTATAAVAAGKLVMNDPVDSSLISLAIILLVGAAIAGFLADRAQAAAEVDVAIRLRAAASARLNAMPPRQLKQLPVGTLVVAMQRHPEAIASLIIGHRAASMMMAVGPLTGAATLFLVSWQAAVLIICLTPVMILFFAFVGDIIRSRAAAQERAFGRLAGQFADRIRALPTILANHALSSEETKLTDRLECYARETMGVLGIAFINAGIIDFFASLSIALLAVFLGLGHLKLMMIPGFSNLELWQSLFILMIAPDYFAPFRRFSEQYHAKAEGLAAAAALDRLLNVDAPKRLAIAALNRLLAPLPDHGLVAIVGPSGSGKSTLLRRLAGIEQAATSSQPELTDFVWVSPDCLVPEGTLAEAIAWRLPAPACEKLREAANAVGLLDDALLPGGLDARLTRGGGNLSGGQKLRISVARALLAGRTVIADEPTAKLDAKTASLVREALVEMSHWHLVVVATHDRELAAAGRMMIDLSNDGTFEVAA